ncbi:MAG TPA: HEAT repeat domain-containing protein [Spirochaetota bacterium]|nr:HEAT repeat domain-containing protein [Spirochaetota bacterium]HPL16435.1 HEAT repeat domain-containing protein [Spirochaetota bacterium]HQF08546.1 HEAT repeat domain-containing protein [Spirochaetota bacterium]HQH97217.1 HEAT repeat domain-containing protein [Spirochaetota bacterium]HQJ70524.1 HEAT repeat domain-containing protein [Spirochaetota bacterium]
MTAEACRYCLFFSPYRQGTGHIRVKNLALFLLFFFCIQPAGCGVFQKSDFVRVQKQREAALRYPGANWIERRDIVRAVVDYYGKDRNDLVIGILTYAAQDPQPAVRIEAVQSLAKIKSDRTLPLVKKTALEDRNDNVRWYAIRALRSFRDPSSADVFIRGLESRDWLIREESIKGICSLDDTTVRSRLIPFIIRALNDPSTSVMLTTLRWIRTRDDRLYAAISEKLRNATEYNYSLIQASLLALRGYQLDSKTKEKVIGLLLHNNPQIRVLALRVLKKDSALEKQE